MSEAINKSTDTGVPKPSVLRQLIAVRPIDPAPEGKSRLKQVLSARALIAIGLGATIGSGIFVLTGTVAANHAGPAITLSLLIAAFGGDRKSTRLNSSHLVISYAVFCLKQKKQRRC